ncbi:helix-turn-helix transcriptional regulator [Caballeronia telluris]|uniref:AraC family transcriptional regulator n=1 Tax=Caballeronia telluris TaxID=326475 RepID=A0A158ITX8_9BURK|nr:helix-turn-helix transcriptional regulator [Caballeronia telluris]SAL59629.1 AraC family transcriptional regulator [Caballeronia telluris]
MNSSPNADRPARDDAPRPGIVSTRFSTHALPAVEQLLAWRARVGHVVDVPPQKTQLADGFGANIDLHSVGGLVFTDARTEAMRLERSVARVSADTRRDFAFHVYAEGETGEVSGVSRKRSAPGSVRGIVAFDMNQPFRVDRPACRVLTMFVPRAIVEAGLGDGDALHGRVVPYQAPLAQLVFDHFGATARELPGLGAENAENAENAADAARTLDAGAQLLIAAFREETKLTDTGRAAVQRALMGQVRRFIDANLHQGDLTPMRVVEALGLKRATLYRWFEHEGGLGAYIRHRRLREAADELVRFPHLQVTDIAYGLGFKSASDFTRAFRRAFDMSPQDARLRSLDLRRDAAARVSRAGRPFA